MNADSGKPEVAQAQVYFATIAEAIRQIKSGSENVARVQLRDELSQKERQLSGVAKAAGVLQERYGLFHNAGYRGMYNMDYPQLCDYKGIPDGRSLLDFMGKRELTANQFRVSETEAKIKNENIRGQSAADDVQRRIFWNNRSYASVTASQL